MAKTFKFELVSPERVEISDDAEQVVVPGVEGDFSVLPGHELMVSTIRPGVIDVTFPNSKKRIFVQGGLAQVSADQTTVLAERSIVIDAADPRQIEAELDAIKKALEENNDEEALGHLTHAIADMKALHQGG